MERSITSGFLAVVSTKLVLLALGLVTSPLFTRLLGEQAYGDYSFLLSVFAIYMIFVSSGVTDGVRKYLAEDRSVLNWTEQVVGFYFRIALVLGTLGALGLVLVARSGLLAQYVGDARFNVYFYLLAGLVFSAQFRAYTRRTLMGFGLERYSELLKVAYRVTFVIVGLSLAALGYGVPGVLVGHIVGSLLAAVGGGIILARRVKLRSIFRVPDRSFPRKEMFFYNGLSIVLVFLLMSLFHVDVMMLRLLTDGPQTGFYKVALILAEFLWVVPTSLQTVLLHSTSEMWSNENRERISQLAARVTRYTMLFTALLAIGIGTLAPIAIPYIWPDSYAAAITPLYLLLPGALGFAIARPILAVGQGKGALNVLILTTGVAAVLNVGLNWVLINQYGILGAAVATSVGYGIMFFLHVWSARNIGFDPLKDARLLRVSATAILSFGPIFLLSRAIDSSLLALVTVPIAGALIYFPIALLAGALGLDESLEILEQFPVVGSWATRARVAAAGSVSKTITRRLQTILAVVGVLFFAAGLLVTLVGAGVPGVPALGSGNQSATGTATPGTGQPVVTETTTDQPETDDAGTATPSTDIETATDPPIDDSDGLFDDETTSATTDDSTATETDSDSTDSPTSTATSTETTTTTTPESSTTTSTETSTSSSTETSTTTSTETTTTSTPETNNTTTSTETNTSTSTTSTSTGSTAETETTTSDTGLLSISSAWLSGGMLQAFRGQSFFLAQSSLVLTFVVWNGQKGG